MRTSHREGVIFLRGETLHTRKWTDVEFPFRQESYFYYLTGVSEVGARLLIDVSTCKAYLFVLKYDQDHELWCGKAHSIKEMSEMYNINVHYASEMSHILDQIGSRQVFVLSKDQLSDDFDGWDVDDAFVKLALDQVRVYKTKGEIELMKEAARITANAHIQLMKNTRSFKNESDGAALFNYECSRKGYHILTNKRAVFQAYTPIVAYGKNGSVLHYVSNNAPIQNSSDMLLVDAGCEYSCYASDVTRTYPVNGKFGHEDGIIYQIVLDSQEAVLSAMKPGVEWEDMHRLAEKVILNGLISAGIVHGEYHELMKHHVAALFFPHGLGHLIGLDVHDVGGYPPGVERIQEPGIRYLRMRRTLQENMVVTVEPGLYFIGQLLDQALQNPIMSKFINTSVLDKFRHIGGVRIEDDVLITNDGIEILTAAIPKQMQEIQDLMSL